MKIGMVSGYYNPCHLGHLDYINAAKKQSHKLIVIVNNDHQVTLKGGIPFMDENHRLEIISNFRSVDEVIMSIDTSSDVCKTIQLIKEKYPHDDLTFFNSGDRVVDTVNSAEKNLCLELGIHFVLLPIPKKYSSSQLIKDAVKEVNKRSSK